jgi:hypothetical protein
VQNKEDYWQERGRGVGGNLDKRGWQQGEDNKRKFVKRERAFNLKFSIIALVALTLTITSFQFMSNLNFLRRVVDMLLGSCH